MAEIRSEMNKVYNVLKTDHGIPKITARYEFALQKLDKEERYARQLNHQDLMDRIGVQEELDIFIREGSQSEDKKASKKGKPAKLKTVH